MKYALAFILLFASAAVYGNDQTWNCEIEIYGHNNAGWYQLTKVSFKLPERKKTNFANVPLSFAGVDAIFHAVYMAKGEGWFGKEPRVEESIWGDIKINNKNIAAGETTALDGTDLPNKTALRLDFWINGARYISRTSCIRLSAVF